MSLSSREPWSSGSVLDHRSLQPVLEYRREHIWRLFHLWLHFITFRGHSVHLAYHVHKIGRKIPITFTWTTRTRPFLSVTVSTIRPRDQELLGELSTKSNTSPTETLVFGYNYLWRSRREIKYSFFHRLQKESARNWTWRQGTRILQD